jgi:hypothetical protein
MPKLFPDSTRLGKGTRPIQPTPASTTKPLNEEQTEFVTATGGTRTLSVNGQVTGALAYDATPATIKSALEALSNVEVNDILVDSIASANEVQTITLGGGNSGGTFTITFNGQTTAAIAFNALGSAVQSALEALSNIAPGDVAVTGGAGGPYVVTFSGVYALENVPLMTTTPSLTGGTNTAVVTSTQSTNRNIYSFQGSFLNEQVDFRVDPALLTGGTSNILVTASSFQRIGSREATVAALASRGFSRGSLVTNDMEALKMRKPKDIGDPDRIPGER